jgi:large subunit ribosomal protein L28
MAKCAFTGKKGLTGMKVSHAHNRTKTVQKANIQKKKFFLASENCWVSISVSTRALRSITKMGLEAFAAKHGVNLKEFVR